MSEKTELTSNRVILLDEVRGFTVVSMVAFHTCYDLAYIYGLNMPWFTSSPFQEIWRCSISWVFLLLAGWMTIHSRNNTKRGLQYAIVAIAVWLATTIAAVDTPISFGIIYCMAACTLLFSALEKPLETLNPIAVLLISLVTFFLTREIPHVVYPVKFLSWLGFPSPTFTSGDYYPLIPFFFMYLVGSSMARWFRKAGHTYPNWMFKTHIAPLAIIGKHSLAVYVVHQPIVLLALMLIMQ